jgi:Rad51
MNFFNSSVFSPKKQIIYARAYTYEHQYNLLLGLAAKMAEEPFRLLVCILPFFIDFSVIVTPYITKAIPIQYHFNNNSGHILPSVILIFYLHIEVFNHHDQTTKT